MSPASSVRTSPLMQATVIASVVFGFGGTPVLSAQSMGGGAGETGDPRATAVTPIVPPLKPLPAESASSRVRTFSFIAYGDTRGRRDGVSEQAEHAVVVDAMLRKMDSLATTEHPVAFVLQSGDAVVNGRDAAQWNVSFVGLINRITTIGGVPYFLAPGNHDVTSSADLTSTDRRTGLQNYLRAIGHLIPPDGASRRLRGYPTYAFAYGNTFVLAFDSNIADDSVQYAWVASQLEGLDRTRYRHVVVFFHHPPLSSGPHGGSEVERPAAAVRARYLPLFRRHGVRMLLTGHEHFFEHWVERYRDGSGTWRRMDQIVSGGGGAPIYTFRDDPDLSTYRRMSGGAGARLTQLVRPGKRERDNPYHFLVIYVDGETVSVEYVGVDWGREHRPYKRPVRQITETAANR